MVYISSISNKQRLNRYFIDINQPNQSVKNMIKSRILSMNLSHFLFTPFQYIFPIKLPSTKTNNHLLFCLLQIYYFSNQPPHTVFKILPILKLNTQFSSFPIGLSVSCIPFV